MVGQEDSYDYDFLILNNFASVDDDQLAAIAEFTNLKQLWLNGDISISDEGLEHLKRLQRLRELSLGDAPVSAQAVKGLRQSLPDCDITWDRPTQDD